MGTRSLIIMRVQNRDGTYRIWCVIYQQFDGYVDGVGTRLINFLSKVRMVNGIPMGKDTTNMANGAGCLFAQIITHFKAGVGGCYISIPDEEDLEEYNYYVDVSTDNNLSLIIKHHDEVLFSGVMEEALHFISKGDEENE